MLTYLKICVIVVMMLVLSCCGSDDPVKPDEPTSPKVTTVEVTNIGISSAKVKANVTEDGGAEVTERGVCWSVSASPTITDHKVTSGNGLGDYEVPLTGFDPETTYHVRAYATNSAGTAYGEDISFKTLAEGSTTTPIVATDEVVFISRNGATVVGTVEDLGQGDFLERGICISANENPTIDDEKYIIGGDEGKFRIILAGLATGSSWHVRAYATNSLGTSYGADLNFSLYNNRLASIQQMGETISEYVYDDDGNLILIKNFEGGPGEPSTSSILLSYDSDHKLVQYLDFHDLTGNMLEFEYNEGGFYVTQTISSVSLDSDHKVETKNPISTLTVSYVDDMIAQILYNSSGTQSLRTYSYELDIDEIIETVHYVESNITNVNRYAISVSDPEAIYPNSLFDYLNSSYTHGSNPTLTFDVSYSLNVNGRLDKVTFNYPNSPAKNYEKTYIYE